MVGHEAAAKDGPEGRWFRADAAGCMELAKSVAQDGEGQGNAGQEALSATAPVEAALGAVSPISWLVSRPFFR